MGLVASLLGWLARKVLAVVATLVVLLCVVVAVQFAIPALQGAQEGRDRLPKVAQEKLRATTRLQELERKAASERFASVSGLTARVADEVGERQEELGAAQDKFDQALEDRARDCGLVLRVVDIFSRGDKCQKAKRAAAQASDYKNEIATNLKEAERDFRVLGDPQLSNEEKLAALNIAAGGTTARDIATTKSGIAQLDKKERNLETAHPIAGYVLDQWLLTWKWLTVVTLLVLVGPLFTRFASYFLLMPVVSRAGRPLRLSDGDGPVSESASVSAGPAWRSLTVPLLPDERLSARSEYVRLVENETTSSVFYSWRSPFISFASGLVWLDNVTGDCDGTSVTLAHPSDPDSYLMRVDFRDHPGIVIYPKHVVGMIGSPELRTRWRWGVQALATGQLRYIMFAGAGSLIIQGCGDVGATVPDCSVRFEQQLVLGFDSRSTVQVARTPKANLYLRGKTALVAERYAGPFPFFWQKSDVGGPSNPVTRTFNALFSAVGKVLGL